MMDMIKSGVLPKNVSPPPDILLLPPMDYLKWIDSLPGHLKYQIMQVSSCSIETQSEKVCLPRRARGRGCIPKAPEDAGEYISQEPHGPPEHHLRQEMVATTFPPPVCVGRGPGQVVPLLEFSHGAWDPLFVRGGNRPQEVKLRQLKKPRRANTLPFAPHGMSPASAQDRHC